MGGMVGGESKSHARGKKKQWKKPRVMIKMDMTPMVDVAFLLLIFFMVTTVFRLPQAMEINLPPETAEQTTIDIKQSTMLNFRVDNDNNLYANVGTDLPKLIPWDSLDAKILERRSQVGTKLTIVAKLLPQAPFSAMVNLLDQFNVDSVTRYSVADWEREDDSVMMVAGYPDAVSTPQE